MQDTYQRVLQHRRRSLPCARSVGVVALGFKQYAVSRFSQRPAAGLCTRMCLYHLQSVHASKGSFSCASSSEGAAHNQQEVLINDGAVRLSVSNDNSTKQVM